ncbi:2-hydroxychromene-2-carboxylate isomerase [Falsiroseomonas selenitidurans]|uniref:2-hydroxychromene-2-carboxylate isomerase n=1 Tax=Falsiroseomonas selenitidurans TaxID=2716335 RepID=A0ABX1EAQ7_9PROT|nr:DsbA family protein [Falsiroseomonas selenitidurans]NKC32858.1 2-hydroxychromene-2-carboxylate isomerase [Falsiroseomonas selenitidurans]
MADPILFWFDFASPYSWLAAEQVEAVAARCGRRVAWRPFLLGVVFRQTGMAPVAAQALRGDYARLDVARLARRLGLDCATIAPSPGCSVALATAFYALPPPRAPRFALAALRATFAEGRDLSTAEAASGLAGLEELSPPAARARLRAATEEALRLGIFGAPYFLADGEPFWGQDRLPMLEATLRRA